MTKAIKTKNAPRPTGPYSQARVAGEFLFVSSQGPFTPAGAKITSSFDDQVRQTLSNIKAVIEAGGGTLDDVVKVTAYLSRLEYFEAFNGVYRTFFRDPPPARTTVAAGLPDIDVAVDATAYVGG